MTLGTLGQRFEASPNALNFVRLCLALEVLLWHSYALRAATWLPAWAERFAGDIAVDGFFAISGFLIVRSWQRSRPGRYALARAARILPGLWACVLVTALVAAPLVSDSTAADKAGFVVPNLLVWPGGQYIGSTLASVPFPYSWNGSLWSLRYEVVCYLLVAAVGSVAVLRSKATVWLGVVAAWAVALSAVRDGLPHGAIAVEGPRTLLMFGCGALLYAYRDRVPMNGSLAILAGLVVVVSVLGLPDYRLIAAPAVAYLMLWMGLALGSVRRLVLRTDLSYGAYIYGFPVQQLLLAAGVSLPWLAFVGVSVAAVLPVAATSWFLVERPAMRFARRTQVTPETRRRNSYATSALVPVAPSREVNPT